MTVVLRPLRDDELPAWIEQHERWYAEDIAVHGGLGEEAARRKAAADVAALFPDGKVDPDSALLAVEAGGEVVGSVWFAGRDGPEGPYAFLYAIQIDELHRGRGIGREAMRLFEQEARARGFATAMLNVFGGNERARGLYRSLGWREASVHMTKRLA
jgi:ribosomal protein S18 acetylase RimI-like enzyme